MCGFVLSAAVSGYTPLIFALWGRLGYDIYRIPNVPTYLINITGLHDIGDPCKVHQRGDGNYSIPKVPKCPQTFYTTCKRSALVVYFRAFCTTCKREHFLGYLWCRGRLGYLS